MDESKDQTSTDEVSTQTTPMPVIATDQSFQNLDEAANSTPVESTIIRVEPDEHELNAESSKLVHSSSAENTSTPPGEAPSSGETLHPAIKHTPSEAIGDTALCDENVASSSEIPLHDQISDDNAICGTFGSDISQNHLDAADQTNHSPAYSNCANADQSDYSAEFTEDLLKIEKSNSLMASDLISSETMNDFFDEMYDMNYANHYKSRKVDESNNLAENYCADRIDGHLKEPDWSAPALVSDFCPAEQRSSATVKSSLKRVDESEPSQDYVPCKKARKGITFDSVSVYYFPRTQGFTCIPSQGGSTLGMSWNHTHIRKFSLGEHAAEQRKAHRQLCVQQLDSTTNWNELSNVSSEDSDSDEIVSDSEVDYENYNFLQPIPTRERRAMLRAAGIHKIDSREKDECRTIRLSREFCGCTCQIYCDPERCVCAQAGIKCQVDRMNFPCSCTRDGCANANGRVEFNPMRVRTHFIHTLMRLEMEKKKEEEEEHNQRLLFGDLDNVAQLSSYPAAALAQSSSAGGANLLTTFTYHPDSLPYYAPTSQQSYDASAPSDSAQLPHPAFGYDGHQYMVAASDSTYGQLTSVSGLTVLGENSLSGDAGEQRLRLAGADYEGVGALAHMHQLAGFHEAADASAALRATSAFHGVEPFFAEDDATKERGLECHSEAETLDTSAEVSEETEKEESDVENFGDIIKKTMVESVIA